MSIKLQLTKDGWKEELKSSGLPEDTQELLSKAIRAVTEKNRHFPRVSEKEFYEILDNQVLSIRLGPRIFILDKNGKKDNLQLVLHEEHES
jgi:hypothetical protein